MIISSRKEDKNKNILKNLPLIILMQPNSHLIEIIACM